MTKLNQLFDQWTPALRVITLFIFIFGMFEQNVERMVSAGFISTWFLLNEIRNER